MPTLLSRVTSAAAQSAVNGGAMTISTSLMCSTRTRSSSANFTVSETVLCIFQLPAMKSTRTLSIGKHCHPWEGFAREEFEGGAAAGGDVRNTLLDAGFLDRRNRIASANN